MQPRRQQRRGRPLGRALLVALLLHAQVIVPVLVVASIYAGREEARRAEEVDVSFESPSDQELPPGLPSIEDLDHPERALPENAKPDRTRPERPKAPPKLAEVKPEPEPPPPEKKPEVEVKPEPKKPKPEELRHEKIVDLDLGQDVEAPPDAKYLAQSNNRVKEETRATDTSLKRAQEGGEASSPSENKESKPGDERNQVAGLEDRKSQSPRDVVPSTARPSGKSAAGQPSPPGGEAAGTLMAMRGTQPREHEITPETVNSSLPRSVDGIWPAYRGPRRKRDAFDSMPGGPEGPSERARLMLTGMDYERIFAAQAQNDRVMAREERSRRVGKFEQRLERVRAAVENFVPEVKTGNQTALNTRKSPFAAFITTMHRQIHELWGFGALEDWNSKPSSNRFNDENLWVKMEIVLNPDGSVDKVGIVRASGYTPFDAAAVDVVWTAGPYPAPPETIHSGNGKVYLHWSFHRDARQCATAWADPFILDNAGQNRDLVAGKQQRPKAAPVGTAGEGGAAQAAHRMEAIPPAARQVAVSWFAALGRHDVQTMTRLSGLPFRSGTEVVATSRAQLAPHLQNILKEASGTEVIGPEMLTPAAARLALGRLPPAVNENPELAFALGQVGDQRIVLALARQESEWRAVGLFLR